MLELTVADRSRAVLRSRGHVVLGLEQLVSTLLDLQLRRVAKSAVQEGARTEHWIVFARDDDAGLALSASSLLAGATGWAAAALRVRLGARLASLSNTYADLKELMLTGTRRPPEGWTFDTFSDGRTLVTVAHRGLSFPHLDVPDRAPRQERRERVYGVCPSLPSRAAPSLLLSELHIVCPAVGASGRLRVHQDGGTIMGAISRELEEIEPRWVGVTIELGTISLGWHEIAALEPGATLEIECDAPIRCMLRMEDRQLALAELSPTPEGLRLSVVEVLG